MVHRFVSFCLSFCLFSCAFFVAWWDGGVQEITELCGNCINKPVSLQRGDQRVREALESSCGGYVQQQSEEMKPIYSNVLLLILWYLILAKLCNSQDPRQYFYFVWKQRHVANTSQMPEAFEWCHICKLPSIGILITLQRHNLITPPLAYGISCLQVE